jgi:hypothetical protein
MNAIVSTRNFCLSFWDKYLKSFRFSDFVLLKTAVFCGAVLLASFLPRAAKRLRFFCAVAFLCAACAALSKLCKIFRAVRRSRW